MKVTEIFDLGLKMAIQADPRGEAGVEKYLKHRQKQYEKMSEKEKGFFNTELLKNPYADSAIHNLAEDKEVRRVLVGIDIGQAELLLASQLNERGKTIDLVIAHHPIGKTLASLHDVMAMQVEIYEQAGVPIHVAEKITEKRIQEVGRSLLPVNHYRVVDIAKLLNINFLNTHTITDNLVGKFLHDYLSSKEPYNLEEMLDMLLDLPEYAQARKMGFGPSIFSGKKQNRVGKFLVEMTGGTNPADEVYAELSRYGISTIVGMHMKDAPRKLAEKNNLNVLIAGHMSSDSLGMNLFLDELEKQGVEIIPCGGLIRVSRNK